MSSGQLRLGFFVAAIVVFLDVLFITPGFGCVVCLYKGAGLNRECICSSEINPFFSVHVCQLQEISIWDDVSLAMYATRNLLILNQPNM